MKNVMFLTMIAMIFFSVFVCQSFADEDSFIPRLARVSALEGDAYYQGTDMFDWEELALNIPIRPGDRLGTDTNTFMEIELDDGNFVRMAESSKMDVIVMDVNEYNGSMLTQLRLWIGDFYAQVQRFDDPGMEFFMNTPTAQLQVRYGGAVFRVIVFADGGFDLRVYDGKVDVKMSNGAYTVYRRQTLVIDSNGKAGPVMGFEWWRNDRFDQWNERRMDYVAGTAGNEQISNTFRSGYNDLERHGRWVDTNEYGDVWVPNVSVGWVPYRYGKWIHMNPWGWTWVSYEPWGWLPYHYGSWTWTLDFGWVWVPGYYWSPGWVSWHYGSGYIGWIALNPWDSYYCTFSVNYCSWFPYYCHRHHNHHNYHNHYTYHQGHGSRGHGKSGKGDHGDYGRDSFWKRHVQNYGESVPINSTHRIGMNAGTTIDSNHFVMGLTITDSTKIATPNISMKKRNWTHTLPDMSNIAAKTGVSSHAMNSFEEYKNRKTSKSDTPSRNAVSSRSRQEFSTGVTSNTSRAPVESSENRNRMSRINTSASRNSDSAGSASGTRQNSQPGTSKQTQGRASNSFRSGTYSNKTTDQKSSGGYTRSNYSRSGTDQKNNTRSAYGNRTTTGKSYTTGNRPVNNSSAGSKYQVPNKQNGIKGFITSLKNLQNKSGSTNTNSQKSSRTNSSSGKKSGSSKSKQQKSSSKKKK